jgi:hypothetical protein
LVLPVHKARKVMSGLKVLLGQMGLTESHKGSWTL